MSNYIKFDWSEDVSVNYKTDKGNEKELVLCKMTFLGPDRNFLGEGKIVEKGELSVATFALNNEVEQIPFSGFEFRRVTTKEYIERYIASYFDAKIVSNNSMENGLECEQFTSRECDYEEER